MASAVGAGLTGALFHAQSAPTAGSLAWFSVGIAGIILARSNHDLIYAGRAHSRWPLMLARLAAAIGVTAAVGAFFGGAAAGATVLGGAVAVLILSPYVRPRKVASLPPDTESALHTLAHAADARSRYTRGHGHRVATNAALIGYRMGWTTNQLYVLRWAALLHDVGEVIIPDSVLLKPGPLSGGECAVVVKHCRAGADAVAAVGAHPGITEAIESHHECWDGDGYPLGLSGREIPLAARVIAVVDVYDALISERPYRSGFDEDVALGIIRSRAGTQFDPDVVAVFEDIHHAGTLDKPRNSQIRIGQEVDVNQNLRWASGQVATLAKP